MESESLLPSDIELAELVGKVGDWLLLAISRLLTVVSTLSLLLLLLELVIPREARGEELRRRSSGRIRRCSRVRTTVISLRLAGSVLSTFRRVWLGPARRQVIGLHGWSELGGFPLRTTRRSF